MEIGIATSAFSLFLPLLMMPGNFVVESPFVSSSTGVDISYPNCSRSVPKTDFGVIGVNGGKVDTVNPCFLLQEMSFGHTVSLYANTGWNNKARIQGPKKCSVYDENYQDCLAYNYGYIAGLFAYTTASQHWVRSNAWWLDVETANTWSDDVVQNRSSLQGEYDALKNEDVANVGVYSTSYQWQEITGSWRSGWPNWGATVVSTANEAKSFCKGHEFTGGDTLLVQYAPKYATVDHDIVC